MNLFPLVICERTKIVPFLKVSLFKIHALSREQKLIRQSEALRRNARRRADERERPNLKSHLPAVIITSHNHRPPSYNYRIILHYKNDNSRDPTRYQPQFASLERCINKRYSRREAVSPFPLSFPLFVLPSHQRFFPPFHPPVETACVSVYHCVRACIRVLPVHLRDLEYHHSSRFLNSLRLLSYFLERGKREHESRALRVCEQRLRRVASLISICRLFVSFAFLFLPLSLSLSRALSLSFAAVHRHRAVVLPFVSYILLLGARR